MTHPDERLCPVTGFDCLTCEPGEDCKIISKPIGEEPLPQGDEVNPNLVRDGQQWSCQKRACYKCTDFKSNMPLTGRCQRIPRFPIMSADMARGDTCKNFQLRPDARRVEIQQEA